MKNTNSLKVPASFLWALLAVFVLSGCGETVRGMGRDLSRVGRGVKTIFISD